MTRQSITLTQWGSKLGHWFYDERRVWLTASAVTACVLILRFAGLLQSSELAAFDQTIRLRPAKPQDDRIVIITIDDQDINRLQTWPISDAQMAVLLETIKSYQPRVIGLDIYRELPVNPGYDALQTVFRNTPNLVGIEKIVDSQSPGVDPPPILDQNQQIGFNNVVADPDGRVRRAMLFWTLEDGPHTSFALRVAEMYLEADGILSEAAASVNPSYLQLGQGIFRRLESQDGAYIRIDSGGYQILANLRGGSHSFSTVSITDVLNGQVSDELMRDRIVLIGSTATSLKDFFYTSYSGGLTRDAHPTAGIELHAQFVSQILTAATSGHGLIQVFPEPLEWGWVFGWALAAAGLCWKIRSPEWSALGVLALGGSLAGICYTLLIVNWWIPMVPPLLSIVGSGVVITGYIAHLEEEFKKSKEFLHSVINTIPDPVYVKDKQHRWIVLNEAYCRLVGCSLEDLLERSEQDFLPQQQADVLREQDDLTFKSAAEHEVEETFTDIKGTVYSIATKRSLHQDAAGNLFLVGIIRDITRRKQMEEELRRTAAELVRSNAELKETESHLRRIAYHDPLTGLPNRKLLHERLGQSIEWAAQTQHLIAILFLDLDGFKLINDTEGHLMGDLLLKAVAQRLTGCLRSSDTVARLGGDEFVVILPAIPSTQHVDRVAQKILNTLSQSFAIEGKTIAMTTSIGISMYPDNGTSVEDLIAAADKAMYSAKEFGKNHYIFARVGAIAEISG
ncbi:MAG: CHASE2 domain-containing protein [Elainellaceae cyanobacterium]